MKQVKILPMLGIAITLFFSSCGGNEEKTTGTTTSADSSAKTTTTPQSTVSTTPQSLMLAWHKVKDYGKWKLSFEAHDSMKNVYGMHNYVLGRSVEDSNLIMVALKADDMAKAKAFAKDPSLKTAMQQGGVVGAPEISFNTIVYQDSAANMSPLRAMMMFTVKDWDAWKTHFESNRQLRLDNGLTDRAYGYDPDDNHKVTLVLAINDTAKANAFMHSDLLKQKRAEAGEVGVGKSHIYHVSQKY